MTFGKTLASAKVHDGKYTIIASENVDKFETNSYYRIDIVNADGLGFKTIPTARTTWKKKFKEVCEEWS